MITHTPFSLGYKWDALRLGWYLPGRSDTKFIRRDRIPEWEQFVPPPRYGDQRQAYPKRGVS